MIHVRIVLVPVSSVILCVCVVMVDGIVAVVVYFVSIDICTEDKYFQHFQRLNFVQAVNTPAQFQLKFKDSDFPNLPDLAEH